MASKLPRATKFRHLLGTDAKPDQCYQDLRPSTAGSETNIIKCSSLFWAIPWAGAGGSVFVRKWDAVGRVEPMPNMLQGHKGEVLDIDFNPFVPNVIATGSDDTSIKVWSVPTEGMTAPITASDYTLEGHQKKVTLVNWHPTASNVLMSCSADNTIKVFDVERSACALTYDLPDNVQHIAWSLSGDRIGTACKDKRSRFFDPRAPAAVAEFSPHLGTKQAKFVWLNGSKCMTIGFGKQAQREIKVWDTRYLDDALNVQELDQSASVMMPYFDADINVVHMGGKGETSIKHFEITEDAPYCHFLTAYNSKEPQRGIAFLPKNSVSVETCEVARIFRLLDKTMVPVRFEVPRKGTSSFQADIYPDTAAAVPALKAAEYFSGNNSNPRMMKQDTKAVSDPAPYEPFEPVRSGPRPADLAEAGVSRTSSGGSMRRISSVGAGDSEVETLRKRVAELEAKLRANGIEP